MAEYISLYLFVSFIALLTKLNKGSLINKNSKLVYIIFVAITLVIGLRHSSMGHDLPGYIENFYLFKEMSLRTIFSFEYITATYEPGYILVLKCLSMLLPNETWYLIVITAISVFPIAFWINKKEVDPYLATIIYMALPAFLLLFSGLRQNIAMAICTISLLYIEKKKPVKFVVMVLIATTMHSSALLFLVCYPVYWIRINLTQRIVSLGIIGIVFVLRRWLFSNFAHLIFTDNDTTLVDSDSYGVFIILCFFYVFEILFMKYSDGEQNGYANILFVACLVQSFASVHTLAMRLAMYFMISLVILFPKTRYSNERIKGNKQILYTIGVVAFILVGVIFLRNGEFQWYESYPYYWFWETP